MGMGQRGISFTIGAVDKFSGPLDEFSAKMAQSTAGLRRLGASMKGLGVSSGLTGVSQSFGGVMAAGTAFASKMALIGGGLGYGFKKGFVDVASQFEDFQSVLTTLNQGDVSKAKEEMAWVQEFAAKTPFQLAQVTEAFVKLRGYGMDPMTGTLQTLGDAAKALNRPINQAVEALADAQMGNNERLKEAFQIEAQKVGNKIVYNYTDAAGKQAKMMAKAGDKLAIQATLLTILGRYKGAMERGSKDWKGLVSNMSDVWTGFANKVMAGGAFDWMKGKLQGILDMVDKMSKDGSLEKLAKEWGEKLTNGLQQAWEAGKGLASAFMTIGAALSVAAAALGGWDNLAKVAVGFMALNFIVSVVTLTKAIVVLGTAMSATPLGMFALAMGVITVNFISATDVLTGLCQTVSLLAVAWGVLSAVFYASPIGWIVAALGLVAFAIQKIIQHWDTLMNAFKGMVPDWVLRLAGAEPGYSSGGSGAAGGGTRGLNLPAIGGPALSDSPRPSFGVSGIQRQINETRSSFSSTQQSKITVDFANTPKGTSIRNSGAPIDLGVDYNMGYAMPEAG